jgi:hypothetical protein
MIYDEFYFESRAECEVTKSKYQLRKQVNP